MFVILSIFEEIILPLFILIAVGVILHRVFHLDNRTLSKLNLYYFVPAIIFVKIYKTHLTVSLFVHVIGFLLLQFVILLIISMIISKLFHFEKGFTASFSNSVVLTNNGNFGIPVNQLAFHSDPYAMAVQIVVLAFQNFLTFTFGLFNAGVSRNGYKKGIVEFFKIPIFYALALGIILNLTHVSIPEFLWVPMNNAANGFISVALVTLGAQVAMLKFKKNLGKVLLSCFLRLIIGPCIGLLLILSLGLAGMTAKALLMATALPTSRNSALLALEYGNESEYAAQAVIISTLCSGITLTIVIYFANAFF